MPIAPDFDLRQHAERSGKDLRYFDQEANERFFPYAIEPAAGATQDNVCDFSSTRMTEETVNDREASGLEA